MQVFTFGPKSTPQSSVKLQRVSVVLYIHIRMWYEVESMTRSETECCDIVAAKPVILSLMMNHHESTGWIHTSNRQHLAVGR